jgi:hypothetical protein
MDDGPQVDPTKRQSQKALSAAAQRALAEADARRREMDDRPDMPAEVGGRNGPEPVRYGDWEKKGIAVDF